MEDQEKNLKELYQQVKELDNGHLLTALAIVMKDTAEFLATRGYNDAAATRFRTTYYDTLNEDRFYWENFGADLYQSLDDSQLPSGMVENAANGQFDLCPVVDANNIFHEWLRFNGWCFFKKFTATHGATAVGEDGLADDQERLCTETEANVVEIAIRLLDNAFSSKWFWYPIAVLLAMMILRTDFATVPDPNEAG